MTKSIAPVSAAPFFRKSGMCRRPRTSRTSPPARLRALASSVGSPDQRCTPPGTTIARRMRAPARSPSVPVPVRRQVRQISHPPMLKARTPGRLPMAHAGSALIGTPLLSVAPRRAFTNTTPIRMHAHGPPISSVPAATMDISEREPDASTTSGVAPPTRQWAPTGICSAHSGQRSSAVNWPYACSAAGAPGNPVRA